MGATSTDFAILGMLTLKPMSGYELRRLIGQSIAHFWSESYGQLYPALKKLEAAKLVNKRTEAGQKRDKHIYAITPAGRKKLGEWLALPPKAQPPRSELLLKLFFLAPHEAATSAAHVRQLRDRGVEELTQFGFIAEQLRSERAGHPQLPQWLFTLNFGRHRAESMLRWADETLDALEQLEQETQASSATGPDHDRQGDTP